MKNRFIIATLSFLFALPASASSDQEREFLERLIETNSEVRSNYELCLEGDNVKRNEVMRCVWGEAKEVDSDGNPTERYKTEGGAIIPGVSENTRRDIMSALEQIRANNESEKYKGVEISEGLQLDGHSLDDDNNIDQRDLEAVRTFFGDRLRKQMFGIGGESGKRRYVDDHSQFYELYKTQLSKNMIEAISSFCIESYPVFISEQNQDILTFIRPPNPQERELVRQRHIELLNTPDPKREGSVAAYDLWEKCAVQIQPICEGKLVVRSPHDNFDRDEYYVTESEEEDSGGVMLLSKGRKLCNGSGGASLHDVFWETPRPFVQSEEAKNRINDFDAGTLVVGENQGEYRATSINMQCNNQKKRNTYQHNTEDRACAVASYMDSTRRNLRGIASITERWNEFQEDSCRGHNCGSFHAAINAEENNIEFYRPDTEEGSDVDSLTTMTSGETVSEEYQGAVTGMQEDMEKCLEGDVQLCEQFVTGNREEAMKEIDELEIRSLAMRDKVDEIEDEDEIEKYLLEEGFSEQEVAEIMDNPDEIRAKIQERYNRMRESVISGLREEVQRTTIDGPVNLNDDEHRGTLEGIQRDLEERVSQTRDLVHFNNVVSGYLQLRSGSDESDISRNTASLYAEADNIHTDFEGSRENLERTAEEMGLERPSDTRTTIEMEVETINRYFLGY